MKQALITPHGIQSEAYRPVRMGSHGAVVANHPLAAQAGMRILHRGGNAVDATVAVGFALGIAEPTGSSIAGDGFLMVYMKDRGRVEIANGTGAAPLAATPSRFQDGIPHHSVKATSVPGLVDALLSTHERYGALPLAKCLEPAIELCEDGVPATHLHAEEAAQFETLMTFPASAAVFAPNGNPLKAGEICRNPNLAKTYRLIGDQGRDAFYEGEIARAIVKFSDEQGGLLSIEDFKRHRVRWEKPIHTTYRGRVVYEAPPNSSGHVLLQELNLFEHFDPGDLGYHTAETIHVMVEAKKLAFADREAYLADPDFVDVPIEGLLSKEYAAARARLIDPERASDNVSEGDPWAFQDAPPDASRRFRRTSTQPTHARSDTTHFCVVDRWGNAVSELQSIQTSFGSCLIAGDTGILLNNRMTYWHLDPEHINCLRPGQRVRHTMNPVMVFSAPPEQGGNLEQVCGTPGADTQVQTNFQLVTGVFDYGRTVVEALDAPRWTHYQGLMTSTYPREDVNELTIEHRVDDEVVEGLVRRGQPVRLIGPWEGAGNAGAILVHPESQALMAASDPRRDGDAAVW